MTCSHSVPFIPSLQSLLHQESPAVGEGQAQGEVPGCHLGEGLAGWGWHWGWELVSGLALGLGVREKGTGGLGVISGLGGAGSWCQIWHWG